jgi:starch synthase
MQSLKIVFIASECTPYAKSGGLADVVGALPQVLRSLGHEVIVILPKYSWIDNLNYRLRPFLSPLGVWMGNGLEWCSVMRGENRGVPTYFIEANKYFDRYGLYNDADFNDYLDNPRRFGFLSRAALQLCRDMGFAPDIVHAHDWQTALAPAYLKIWHWDDPVLGGAASLLTIHNIAYQGVYPASDFAYLGLQTGNFTPEKFEDHGGVNFLKGGIHYADVVNTVSPTYAVETRAPIGGHGLAPFLNARGEDYVGILNGVDYSVWDPSRDPLIPAHYSSQDLSGKEDCKRALQQRFLLNIEPDTPLFGTVSRFVPQKGLDILQATMDRLLASMRMQFVILGSGEKGLEWYYGGLPARYPGRVGSYIGYHEEIAHWIEAGVDFFLMPSRFEPCGLNQIYSLRYGALPVVRAIGGLEDTVQQYDERSGSGTGFKFWDLTPDAIFYTLGWVANTYEDRRQHIQTMMHTAMAQDYSWERSAQEYVRLYERAIRNKRAA